MEEGADGLHRAVQALTGRAAGVRAAGDGRGRERRAFAQHDVHAGVLELAVKVAQLALQGVDLRVNVLELAVERLQFGAVRGGGDQLVEAVPLQTQRFQTALRVVVVVGDVLAVDGRIGHLGHEVERLQKGVQLGRGYVGGDGGVARALLPREGIGDDVAVVFLDQIADGLVGGVKGIAVQLAHGAADKEALAGGRLGDGRLLLRAQNGHGRGGDAGVGGYAGILGVAGDHLAVRFQLRVARYGGVFGDGVGFGRGVVELRLRRAGGDMYARRRLLRRVEIKNARGTEDGRGPRQQHERGRRRGKRAVEDAAPAAMALALDGVAPGGLCRERHAQALVHLRKRVADGLGVAKLLATGGAALRMAQKRLPLRGRHFAVDPGIQVFEELLAVHAHALLSLVFTHLDAGPVKKFHLRRKNFTKFRPGAADARFDGADIGVQHVGDLVVGAALYVAQHHGGAHVLGKFLNGALEGAALLGAHGVVFRGIHVVHRRPSGVYALIQRGGLAALAAAQLVQTGVHGDAVDPGGKGGLALKTGNGAIDAQHRLLKAILRILPMPAHAQGDRVHAPLLRCHQLGKRLTIALRGPLDEGLFIHLHAATSFPVRLLYTKIEFLPRA